MIDTEADSDRPFLSLAPAARSRYKWLVVFAAGLTLVYIGATVWMALVAYRDFGASLSPLSRFTEASAVIGELDEAMTMSARMAAATGDHQWEDRYRQLEPKLDAAIQQARTDAPGAFAGDGARQADEANRALVAIEHRALELTRLGQRSAASALLSSADYHSAKATYADGLRRIRSALGASSSVQLTSLRLHVKWSLVAAAAALPILVIAWIGAVRAERGYAAARRAAESDLRASETRYRSLFQSNPQPMWVYDPATLRFLTVNDAAVENYGYSHDEFLAMTIADIRPPEDLPRLRETVAHAAKQGFDASGIWSHRKRDGTFIDVDIRSHKVDFLGRPAKLVLAHDVTEQRRAEAATRLQSAALNAAANAIVITDRHGSIDWVNPAFTSLTGYALDEALGRNPRELVKSGVHDRAFYTDLWKTILAGDVWRGEMTNRRKDGTLYVVEETITLVKDASGATSHFIAIKRDLTAEKQLQAQFLQVQKMETVGRLAGGIAHDFNNLLTVINGTADLASARLAEDDPLRADLKDIHEAGERAAALTRQLLAFSRKQIMNPIVLDLRAVVADMRSMLQRLIGEDVELVVVASEGAGRVKADLGQIQQVVLNLAVNARDAMPAGGTLTIEIRDVDVGLEDVATHPASRPGPRVMLAVSDSGVGMDDTTRLRVFEPFFTTKQSGQGTGLGLATVYGIVTQSGGSIRVDSQPDRGTTFTIHLPRLDEALPEGQLEAPSTPVAGTETILVVEDEEALRAVARRMLESAGYTVLLARNGREALQVLDRHDGTVHLVLTDVVMPGISGPELVARLAVLYPEIRVLYTSGYTDDAILRRGITTGVAHFIGKPYSLGELPRKVRAVLDKTSVEAPAE